MNSKRIAEREFRLSSCWNVVLLFQQEQWSYVIIEHIESKILIKMYKERKPLNAERYRAFKWNQRSISESKYWCSTVPFGVLSREHFKSIKVPPLARTAVIQTTTVQWNDSTNWRKQPQKSMLFSKASLAKANQLQSCLLSTAYYCL